MKSQIQNKDVSVSLRRVVESICPYFLRPRSLWWERFRAWWKLLWWRFSVGTCVLLSPVWPSATAEWILVSHTKKANHPQALSDPCLLDFFAEGQDVWLRPLQGDEGQENGKCGKNTKCLKYVSQVSKQSGFRLFLRFKHWNPQLWYFLPVKHALWGCTVTIYTHG